MLSGQVLRRLFITGAVAVGEAKTQAKNEEERCRPSDLPIYSPDYPKSTLQPGAPKEKPDEIPPTGIENAIKGVRQTITSYTNEIRAYERVGVDYIKEGKDNVQWLVNYLQEENNTTPKAGAIGIGGLTGLIFGMRGGLFKKTVYATAGALSMASLCYPKEASEYAKTGLSETKKMLTIAYNFAYGVKKDEPPLELPSLPKLPTSVPEVWENIKDTALSLVSDDSSKKSTGDKKSKETK